MFLPDFPVIHFHMPTLHQHLYECPFIGACRFRESVIGRKIEFSFMALVVAEIRDVKKDGPIERQKIEKDGGVVRYQD